MTELGEELVEAAQILLYQKETTPRCSLSRHPDMVHTVFGCREPCDEDHQSPDHRWDPCTPGMTELEEQERGEELVEAAQILLYQRETTPRCSLSRRPKTA
jgi:hypothetical protein